MNYHVFEDKKFDLKFDFTDEELNDFIELWNGEISAENIATKMKRKPIEIVLLIMDRAELGLRINQRTSRRAQRTIREEIS